MLDRYIKINERVIISGQTSSGIWYCKELPSGDPKEADKLIGELNTVYNKYNRQTREKTTSGKKPDVKGLE